MFTGIVSVKLSQPIKWEGREISVIDLDFGKVSGKIVNQCERQTSGNLTAAMRPLSTDYTSHLASMISGVPHRAIEDRLSFEDFELICTVVQKFLMKEDPQQYYDELMGEKMGFTTPAAEPETPLIEAGKEKNTKTS